MGDNDEAAGFWLPSEFFNDDDFLADKEILKKNTTAGMDSSSGLCFPSDFPYHFETKNHENLKNCWVMSTSPQSTLSHHGSWSSLSFNGSSNSSPQGVSSPPATPLGHESDSVRDLIHRAAGQVASLKLSGNGNLVPGPTKHTDFPGPHKFYAQHAKTANPSFLQYSQFLQQNQGCGVYQSRNGGALGDMGQAAWTNQQYPTRLVVGSGATAVLNSGYGGGGAVKRKCAGTGVFMPRSFGHIKLESNAYASGSRKKTGLVGLVPERTENHVFTKNYDNLTDVTQSHPASQTRFSKGFIQDHEARMARRNAIVLQQRTLFAERSTLMSRDMYLPQEWTY